MTSEPVETEIKLPVRDLASLQRKLQQLGFDVRTPRTFESNVIYDTPEDTLRNKGCLLRVREYGTDFVLTYKGAAREGRHKVREEVETKVESASALCQILERLGYRIAFRYEKYRTEYSDGEGAVVVDETPIGSFLELEGGGPWIDRVARRLGYEETDYITKSYGTLYRDFCATQIGTSNDMLFSKEPYGTSLK